MERICKVTAHVTPNACTGNIPEIKYEVLEGGIALLTLNRPDRLNALTTPMQGLYFDLLEKARDDPAVKVIIVTGAGRAFCAGADFDLLQTIGSKNSEVSMAPSRNISQTQALSIPKPIIGAINGPCAGLGFVMATMMDIRFAVSGAKFTTAFAKRGLVAEHGISFTLPRIVGTSYALDILMSSRVFLAEEAKEMGLVSKVFPDTKTLINETIRYARDMGSLCSPASLASMKVQVYRDLTTTAEDANSNSRNLMFKSFQHPDSKEGVASYLEKRTPKFQGLSYGRIEDL